MKQLTKKEAKKVFKQNKRNIELILVLENIQYATNVASMFRTADAAGVRKVVLTGISKVPPFGKDLSKASRHKEKSMPWEYKADSVKYLSTLKKDGYKILSAEITDDSIPLEKLYFTMKNYSKICIVVGNEVYGINKKTLAISDISVYIPMYGKGASLNVSTVAGIILFSI
jgi:tRNA G18 (ribose-2'-O)-methylase SpoU